MDTTFTPRCQADTNTSSWRYMECRSPDVAMAIVDYQNRTKPICKKHASIEKRRKYHRGTLTEITPAILIQWEKEAAAQAVEAKAKSEKRAAENAARRIEDIARAEVEDAQGWESVRDDRIDEGYDWKTTPPSIVTTTNPRWLVKSGEDEARVVLSSMGVEVIQRDGFPPVLEARTRSEITPKMARAFAQALIEAADAAEGGAL